MEPCLFCGKLEHETENDSVCSCCVQLMLDADQADLERAYDKAVEKGNKNKARALQSFLIPDEDIDGQRKPVTKSQMLVL